MNELTLADVQKARDALTIVAEILPEEHVATLTRLADRAHGMALEIKKVQRDFDAYRKAINMVATANGDAMLALNMNMALDQIEREYNIPEGQVERMPA